MRISDWSSDVCSSDLSSPRTAICSLSLSFHASAMLKKVRSAGPVRSFRSIVFATAVAMSGSFHDPYVPLLNKSQYSVLKETSDWWPWGGVWPAQWLLRAAMDALLQLLRAA